MRFTRAVRIGALAAVAATALAAQPAHAATGQVVAFTHEFDALQVWVDPSGCHTLPIASHLIFNQTDQVVVIYADPLCLLPIEPFARVKPGYGTHVSAVGSFRAP
ncbi:hypothetical protein ACFQV2_32540 [Actinokineospora soli]|uniref:Secreted protein n=1 Tax=Actinokineospora soli TaxID=1048753 RepID=A0ABW2TVT3_9PSEU